MADTHQGYDLGSPEYKRIIFSLFLAGVVTFALLYNVQPLLPDLSSHFHISADRASLSVSGATLGLAVALLFAGPVSDKLGRRPTILISLYLSALTALAIPFAPTWTLLLVLRVIQGAALAGLPAVAVVYLAEELIPQAQTRAAGIYIGGTGIGGMTGRLVSGFLNDVVGWRVALAIMGVLAVVIAIAATVLLPKQRGFTPASIRLKAIAKSTKHVLSDPVIWALYGVGAMVSGANVGMFNIIGYYTKEQYGFTSTAISLLFLTYIVGSFASTWTSRQASIFGLRKVLPFPIIVLGVGIAVMYAPPLWMVIIGLTLANAGFFGSHGVASGWVALRAKAGAEGVTGQAAAGYSFFYYMGSSVFGYIVSHMWAFGWHTSLASTAVLAGIALALSLFLKTTTSLESGPNADNPADD